MRDRTVRVMPSCLAAYVTVKPMAGSMSSRRVAPGCSGLNIRLINIILMIALIIDQDGIAALEREGEPPVGINQERAKSLEITCRALRASALTRRSTALVNNNG